MITRRLLLLFFPLGLALCLPASLLTPPAQAQVAVTVEFEESTYTVAESDDSSTTEVSENEVEVKVTLSADPLRTVIIPIMKTNEGGATNSDYSGVPASVTFDSGETEQTFTFTATADTADDDEDKVKLSFGTLPMGVTAGTTAETTVTITDDDFPQVTVSFGAASYSVDETGIDSAIRIVVRLSAAPERNIRIPLTQTLLGGALQADFSVPLAVQFRDDETESAVLFSAQPDTDEDHGESVRLGFGTPLPERVTASGTTTTTVTIIDDDPAVMVTIRTTTAEVEEGERARFLVEFPEPPVRPVSIPLVFTYQGGAEAADLTNIPTSVDFAENADSAAEFFLFTAEDAIADHGESIQVSFGTDLPPGVSVSSLSPTATVTIIDDDPAVTVSMSAIVSEVLESETVRVTVQFDQAPVRPLSIPITVTYLGGATPADLTNIPASVEFPANDDGSRVLRLPTTDDTIPDHGESIRVGFGTLPPGVTLASTNTTARVTIIDDDPEVSVTFGALADLNYSIAEGDEVVVPVVLSAAPQRPLSIPITFSYLDGGTADDHMCTGAPVVFAAADTTRNMTCRIVQDAIPDHAEIIQTNFGTLPPGVILGHVDDTTVQIVIIDDDPAVTASFGAATYSVGEGDSVDVTVTLSADPQRTVTIPITTTNQSGASSADYTVPSSVTFASGDTSKTISFSATDDTIDDDDEKIKLAFGTFPPG